MQSLAAGLLGRFRTRGDPWMGDDEGSEGMWSDVKVNKLSTHTPSPVAPPWQSPISSYLQRCLQNVLAMVARSGWLRQKEGCLL